jgi:hypothetical protein
MRYEQVSVKVLLHLLCGGDCRRELVRQRTDAPYCAHAVKSSWLRPCVHNVQNVVFVDMLRHALYADYHIIAANLLLCGSRDNVSAYCLA